MTVNPAVVARVDESVTQPSGAAGPVAAVRPETEELRLVALDSLRGLAALTVVLCHAMWLGKPDTPLETFYRTGVGSAPGLAHLLGSLAHMPVSFFIEITPLHLFVAGREAVILFYLLSGFVLYLTYERHRAHRYRTFLVRRICRIYLPYLVAIVLAIGLNATVSTGHLPEMNGWFNYTWHKPVNWSQALRHLSLVGNFDTDRFLMPSWSLVHEMRMSIVFPLLAAIVVTAGGWLPAAVVALSAAGIVLDTQFGSLGNYFITVHYAAFFLVGASLARHRRWSMNVYRSLRPVPRAVFLTSGLTLYAFGRMLPRVTGLPVAVGDLPVGVGATLIILWGLSSPRLLLLAPARWLGKVSYALYLLHFSIFLASIYLLHALLPLWAILLFGLSLSLLGAALFFRYIEAPAIRLGRQLTSGRPHVAVGLRVASPGLLPPREGSW